MAVEFEKLQFTRDWNNSSDFPTYEENEQKVRADMQALHDEVKTFINEKLIPAIQNMAVPGAGDMLAEIYDPTGKRTDIYQYVKDVSGGYKTFREGGEPETRGDTVLYGKILADYREVTANG